MNSPWSLSGYWFKGALHVHTSCSDGKLSPQEVVDTYAAEGYDFVVFTDHGQVTPASRFQREGMLVISGVEVGAGRSELGAHYHIVGVGLDEQLPEDLDQEDAQQVIDWLKSQGAVVMIAHPYWSMLTLKDLLALEGYDGIEVFNAGCEWETRHGDASQHWDWLLTAGRSVLGYAVDDAHFGFRDYAGGWVLVRAQELTQEAILQALRSGHFYSSSGPAIYRINADEDGIRIRCTACAAIHVIIPREGRGYTTARLCKQPPCDREFTEITLPAPPAGQTFRIECVDAAGRKAWTNPMRLE